MFYLWSSVLLGLAMGFVVWALLRPTKAGTSKVSRQRMVTALYRDRLQELRGEVSDSQIDGEARADLEQELGAALLTDYAEETDEVFHASGNVGLAAMSAGLLMVGALLVYPLVGDPAALQLSGAEEILQMDPSQDAEALDGWRRQLVDRVDSQPGDAESWYLL
ncbi:MAG: c-type cytochrome biogenesis protein CcmI, partial [Pseudomonadales bacterium]